MLQSSSRSADRASENASRRLVEAAQVLDQKQRASLIDNGERHRGGYDQQRTTLRRSAANERRQDQRRAASFARSATRSRDAISPALRKLRPRPAKSERRPALTALRGCPGPSAG